MNGDYVALNVPGLLKRYENPPADWREIVLSLARTQIRFFKDNGLLSPVAEALSVPVEQAVLKFSDFTEEGRRFIKSGAVDRWLAACDKRGTVTVYDDPSGLMSRLKKFRSTT